MEFIRVQHVNKVKLKQLLLQLEYILSLGRQLTLWNRQHMLGIFSRFILETLLNQIWMELEAHLGKILTGYSFAIVNVQL